MFSSQACIVADDCFICTLIDFSVVNVPTSRELRVFPKRNCKFTELLLVDYNRVRKRSIIKSKFFEQFFEQF